MINNNLIKLADVGLVSVDTLADLPFQHHIAPEVLLGSTIKTKSVDIWAFGYIFIRIATNKRFFSYNLIGNWSIPFRIRQIYQVCRVMGAPTEETWSGVTQLPFFGSCPNWRGNNLADWANVLGPLGVNLVEVLTIFSFDIKLTSWLKFCF